jgi:hypothetical protein
MILYCTLQGIKFNRTLTNSSSLKITAAYCGYLFIMDCLSILQLELCERRLEPRTQLLLSVQQKHVQRIVTGPEHTVIEVKRR